MKYVYSFKTVHEIARQRASALVLLIIEDGVVANEGALRCEDRLRRRSPIRSDERLSRTVRLMNLGHGICFGSILDAATNTTPKPSNE